jgi:hypothetical protein
MFNFSNLILNQVLTSSNILVIANLQSINLGLVTTVLVSSAYKKILVPLTETLVISFIYKRKKSGTKIEPWGTPDFTSAQLDEQLLELFSPSVTL